MRRQLHIMPAAVLQQRAPVDTWGCIPGHPNGYDHRAVPQPEAAGGGGHGQLGLAMVRGFRDATRSSIVASVFATPMHLMDGIF